MRNKIIFAIITDSMLFAFIVLLFLTGHTKIAFTVLSTGVLLDHTALGLMLDRRRREDKLNEELFENLKKQHDESNPL